MIDLSRRLAAMTDGTGTTTYRYVPVGQLGALQLQEEIGTLPNGKIGYAYDRLGRVVTATSGAAAPRPSNTTGSAGWSAIATGSKSGWTISARGS